MGNARWIVVGVVAVAVGIAACASQNEGSLAPVPTAPETTSIQVDVTAETVISQQAEPIADDAVVEPHLADNVSSLSADELAATTFSGSIQPMLENSCSSCHAPGQAGSGEFSLATAADAVANADSIKLYTASGVMPPWPASSLSLAFVGDHSLTVDDVARIAAWSDAGAPLDVDPSTPVTSAHPASFLSGDDRDIVMTPVGGGFAGSVDKPDEYRCLVYEPGNDELKYIVGSHFEADQTEVVHHAIVTLVSGALRDQAAALDERDPGAGWTCFGGIGFEGGVAGGYQAQLGGWAPGAQASRLPDGYAIPLTAGDFIVVQIHYHYHNESSPDLSRFVLSLASDEQIEANAGWFKSLNGQLFLGPAEIPCYAGDTNPLCDRATALARVKELYGARIGALPDYFLNQCGASVSDFAGMTDGTSRSTCDLPARNPGRIVAVSGHMHELGLSIRLTLNPDTPEERILLDIPDWDFEWQLGYRPVDDVFIEPGDIVRVDCAWNRERAPYEAEGYVLWSDGTGDEMCYSSITTAPLD